MVAGIVTLTIAGLLLLLEIFGMPHLWLAEEKRREKRRGQNGTP